MVDTRTEAQRQVQGSLPGALVVDRTVLEWRLDPTSAFRIPEAVDHDVEIVVVCAEGYSSSLAAVSLQELGLHRATDLEGGFLAWRAAGMPAGPAGPSRPDWLVGAAPPAPSTRAVAWRGSQFTVGSGQRLKSP